MHLTVRFPHRAALRGFTLVELMIGIAVMTILILAAAPSLQGWIFNSRVRTTAESLQNGLRLAQAEAVRQSRQVVFSLTNAAPGLDAVTADDGRNWTVQTVPIVVAAGAGVDGGVGRFIRGGPLADATAGVLINGSAGAQSICFSSVGNLTTNPAPAPAATGAVCAVDPAAPLVTYDISHPRGDRNLRVTVSIGGRVRMCDPNKALATNPDGCA